MMLFVVGLLLQWDLTDWLTDAVGMLFLLAGAGVGIADIIRVFTGSKLASA